MFGPAIMQERLNSQIQQNHQQYQQECLPLQDLIVHSDQSVTISSKTNSKKLLQNCIILSKRVT